MGMAQQIRLEAEMDIIEALTPPADWDNQSETAFNKQARFMGAVVGRMVTRSDARERKNALARLMKRGEVVSWRNYGKRSNYALAEENARARQVIRRRVRREYEESRDQQVEALALATNLNDRAGEIVKALHKAGYAIVPRDNIRHTQYYLPRRDEA